VEANEEERNSSYADRGRPRCGLGLALSVVLDLPSGAVIVWTLAASFVTLPRMAAKEVIQLGIAAVERLALMHLRDRRLAPIGQAHFGLGRRRAARRSRAFGAGGFSSMRSTRRLSRSDKITRSACSMIFRAASNA
jgi:hypothetical protein